MIKIKKNVMNKLFLALSVFMITFLGNVDAQNVRIFYAGSEGKPAYKDMSWYQDCDDFYAANPNIKKRPMGCTNIPAANTDWCNVAKDEELSEDCKKAIFSDCSSCRCAADLVAKEQRIVTDCIVTEAGTIVTIGETLDSLFTPIESRILAKRTIPSGKPQGDFQIEKPPVVKSSSKPTFPTQRPTRPKGKPSGL